MNYHISTGLIWDKFKEDCECPLCEIQKIVEEQFLHEFLNDAVMEDSTRIKVNKLGFCGRHFKLLLERPNKLSVALQMDTRTDKLLETVKKVTSVKDAKKQAEEIEKSLSTCIICDLVEESMTKYYKTVAQMFNNEKEFRELFSASKGFCLHHYAELLRYSSFAGIKRKEYLIALSEVQKKNMERVQDDLKKFCFSHDYRNAGKPLKEAETALPRTGIKIYGKK